jgi:hypothetical protein
METNTSPSTAQHTPGPWYNNHQTVFAPNGEVITEASASPGEDQMFANAHLIAAAPELLEVLRDIMDEAEFGDPSLEAKARAAIAKATGRTV